MTIDSQVSHDDDNLDTEAEHYSNSFVPELETRMQQKYYLMACSNLQMYPLSFKQNSNR